jgi:DnaJ-class molecular chaperone
MVTVRKSQMIGFGNGFQFNIEMNFGNPVDLEKVLEWELERLNKGMPTRVTITGWPFRQFYKEYIQLKKERGIFTVRKNCKFCDGTGQIEKEEKQISHWSGVKLKAFKGLVFKVPEWCKACEGFGYREFLFSRTKPTNDGS